VVRDTFVEGLHARGLLADGNTGTYGLQIGVKRLDSSQLVRREAHSKFDISVIDKASGKHVYSKTAEDNRSDEGSLATGILASTEDLRKITNDSLQAAIERPINPSRRTVKRSRRSSGATRRVSDGRPASAWHPEHGEGGRGQRLIAHTRQKHPVDPLVRPSDQGCPPGEGLSSLTVPSSNQTYWRRLYCRTAFAAVVALSICRR
jgi:hypothetical protein